MTVVGRGGGELVDAGNDDLLRHLVAGWLLGLRACRPVLQNHNPHGDFMDSALEFGMPGACGDDDEASNLGVGGELAEASAECIGRAPVGHHHREAGLDLLGLRLRLRDE